MVRGDFTVPYRKKGFPAAIYYLSLVIVPVMFFFFSPDKSSYLPYPSTYFLLVLALYELRDYVFELNLSSMYCTRVLPFTKYLTFF